MADWVSKRTQFIEEYGAQSDGDKKYRLFPWQHVVYEGRGFLEPVDYPVGGLYVSAVKEITSYAEVDGDSQFVPGNSGTGGNVGILRG
jgi:hypothetical protein